MSGKKYEAPPTGSYKNTNKNSKNSSDNNNHDSSIEMSPTRTGRNYADFLQTALISTQERFTDLKNDTGIVASATLPEHNETSLVAQPSGNINRKSLPHSLSQYQLPNAVQTKNSHYSSKSQQHKQEKQEKQDKQEKHKKSSNTSTNSEFYSQRSLDREAYEDKVREYHKRHETYRWSLAFKDGELENQFLMYHFKKTVRHWRYMIIVLTLVETVLFIMNIPITMGTSEIFVKLYENKTIPIPEMMANMTAYCPKGYYHTHFYYIKDITLS